jgi:RsiW-degrading membrane proteinase PrsW (M82 family)
LLYAIIFIIAITWLYTWLLWQADRYEREPRKLLLASFLWGAIPAIALSLVLEEIFSVPMSNWIGSGLSSLALASGVAPVVEESIKGLALLGLYRWAYWEFDDVLDGIVYGGTVGFGFAMVETIFYVAGSSNPIPVMFLRMIIFGLSHAFFTGLTGAFLGLARTKRSHLLRAGLPVLGWLLAVGFHAMHNLGASVTNITPAGLLLSIFSDWTGILWLLVVILLAKQQERRWIAGFLEDEIGVSLNEEEYRQISSLGAGLKKWLKTGPKADRKLKNELYSLAVELAFKKAELRENISPEQNETLEKQIDKLRKQMILARTKLKGDATDADRA